MSGERPTLQASRLVAGHCPECGAVCAVLNDYETWPLVECACGWAGATTALANRVRLERNFREGER